MTRTTMITASRKLPPTPATIPTVETEKLPSMLPLPKLEDETVGIGETEITGIPDVREVAGVLNVREIAGVLNVREVAGVLNK